jgi:hypothetical protein
VQLVAVGLSDRAIHHRVRVGRLFRVYRGVYAVGRPPKTALEFASAALLACGPGAALGHGSGMALWGFWKVWPKPFEVTFFKGDRRPKHVKHHHPTGLTHEDIRRYNGLWVTSPARTLLDVAPVQTRKQRARAVSAARLSHHLKLRALRETLARFPNHPGTPLLLPLAQATGNPTRSLQEDDFPSWCRRSGLPVPLLNEIIAGYEVDAVFLREKVIVELDSWDYHQDRYSFEVDRLRDSVTTAAGFVTVRLTQERWTPEEADRLKKILDLRRAPA